MADVTINSSGIAQGFRSLGDALFSGNENAARDRLLNERARTEQMNQQQKQLELQAEKQRQSAAPVVANNYADIFYPRFQQSMPITGPGEVSSPVPVQATARGGAVSTVPAGSPVNGPATLAQMQRQPMPFEKSSLAQLLTGVLQAGGAANPDQIMKAVTGFGNNFGITMGGEALARPSAIASGAMTGAPSNAVTVQRADQVRAEDATQEVTQQNAKNELAQILLNSRLSTQQGIAGMRDGTTRDVAGMRDGTTRDIAGMRDGTARDIAAQRGQTAIQIATMQDGTKQVIATMQDGTRRAIAADSEEGRRLIAGQADETKRLVANQRAQGGTGSGAGSGTPNTPTAMVQADAIIQQRADQMSGSSVRLSNDQLMRVRAKADELTRGGKSYSVAMDEALVSVIGAEPRAQNPWFGGMFGGTPSITPGGVREPSPPPQGAQGAAPIPPGRSIPPVNRGAPTAAPATATTPQQPAQQPAAPKLTGRQAFESASDETVFFSKSTGKSFVKRNGQMVEVPTPTK